MSSCVKRLVFVVIFSNYMGLWSSPSAEDAGDDENMRLTAERTVVWTLDVGQ